MALTSPDLDDRDFAQLMSQALDRLRSSCSEWTDLSAGDPGIVLLELFAYLTEVMIYRLNRVPEKVYMEFLRLLGVQLEPPAAAAVRLHFSLPSAASSRLEIPAGTRVTVGRTQPSQQAPIFRTGRPGVIEKGKTSVELPAYHCDMVQGELAGQGTGQAGQWVRAARIPIAAGLTEDLELLVGVEAVEGELTARSRAVEYAGKAFQIWSEVDSFADLEDGDGSVYRADRNTGTITFAPEVERLAEEGLQPAKLLARVPGAGKEIRLWYPTGGGPEGNLAAQTLTLLKDPIPKLQVTNPQPAAGGRAAETLENAVRRGPLEFHSLQRAVTARDYELLAVRRGAVSRAKAFTSVRLWAHARPGEVQVLMVPLLPEPTLPQQLTPETLEQHHTEEVRKTIEAELESKRPLGTSCGVSWVRYKAARVKGRIVVYRGEDPKAVQARVLERLYQTICPLPLARGGGWRFGRSLRSSHVFDIVLSEPGVAYADRVRLRVDDVPDSDTFALAADAFQPRTWYAGAGSRLFRSFNEGAGWERAAHFEGQEVRCIRANPERAGLVVAVTRSREDAGLSVLYLSRDSGESWDRLAQTAFAVNDADWLSREGQAVLLLASDVGLYELSVEREAVPLQILVDPARQKLGFYAVCVATDLRGTTSVAVAAHQAAGVFLSPQAARPESFRQTGLEKEDVRVLRVQYDGPRVFLWAGCAASGNQAGKGCFRLELRGSELAPEGWRHYQRGWAGGSCRSLALLGMRVMAATHRAGVLWLESGERDPEWQQVDVNCGLPLRDVGRLHPVDTVACDPSQRAVMAGGVAGVFRSFDQGVSYHSCSEHEFLEKVTLPETWLFCSGQHEIEVVNEDEARGD